MKRKLDLKYFIVFSSYHTFPENDMKKFKLLSLLLIVLLFAALLPVSATAVTEPDINAKAAIIVDADSGEVYFEKNADQRIQPASTTKLMTALLVIEDVERGSISLGDAVVASENCSYNLDDDSTNANPRIQPGESMSVQDLLYCTMLVSANEACNILAEYVSGTVSDFVDKMNARAEELGCTGTHFANANGLEDSDHYSTAADFAIIAREAMSHTMLQQICSTLNYTVPETNVTAERTLTNTNMLLNSDSEYYYPPAYGIKTGFFTNAGYCLVSAAEKDNMNVICVVMGGVEADDQFRESVTLFNWLFDNYEYRQILSSAETIVTVPVYMGTSETTGVRAEDPVSVILPRDYDIAMVGYQYVLYHEQKGERLEAPINAGEALGEISVVELDSDGNAVRTFGSSKLVATSTVEMSRVDYIRSQLTELFQTGPVRKIITILIILLAAYLLLVVFYFIQRIRHLRSMRLARKDRARRRAAEDAEWLTFPDEPENSEPAVDFFSEPESTPVKLEEPKAPAPAPAPIPEPEPKRDEPAEPARHSSRYDFADDDFFDSFFQS